MQFLLDSDMADRMCVGEQLNLYMAVFQNTC